MKKNAPGANQPSACGIANGTAETREALDELIELHEAINWRDVPNVQSIEAATWTKRLNEAKQQVMVR